MRKAGQNYGVPTLVAALDVVAMRDTALDHDEGGALHGSQGVIGYEHTVASEHKKNFPADMAMTAFIPVGDAVIAGDGPLPQTLINLGVPLHR